MVKRLLSFLKNIDFFYDDETQVSYINQEKTARIINVEAPATMVLTDIIESRGPDECHY
ncbi:hypothetical protein [Brevibacillus laterosporus]|uniref:hypothetical protein n=1 Tax=Brevibacillus laterosporus TaxID=1465 RepID=UPI003D1CE8EB